ncbi:Uncharacterised protein [Yersinia kristensenii]|nr:hypothetical protein AW19_3586 [Yersinia frederiksenii Y225]CNH09079.1 Uncharacterised protein [Yersinia kristensenii]CRY64141.1 Uncharacterised protein [Yersinia kristensenii]
MILIYNVDGWREAEPQVSSTIAPYLMIKYSI